MARDRSARVSPNGQQKKRVLSAINKAAEFHVSVAKWMGRMPDAPVFHPTPEEWKKPMAYIRKIRPEAEPFGICKIIPPMTSSVPASTVIRGPHNEDLYFRVRHQPINQRPVANMECQRFVESPDYYEIMKYYKAATEKEEKLTGACGPLPERMAEAEYWRRRTTRTEKNGETHVEYGNDVEGTAFCDTDSNDPLGSSPWNMRVLPTGPGSTLKLLETPVPGVSTPMLYIGMIGATFAWHVEDHYLYSINYQHQGAAKTWYGVGSKAADAFEKACEKHIFAEALAKAKVRGDLTEADYAKAVHSVLLEKTTMFSPEILLNAGVPVCRTVQRPGEFVVTFPRAYHGGFSHGFSIGEAVNFATGDWFLFGNDCCERYSRLCRMPIVPHESLICKAALKLHDALRKDQLPPDMDWEDARSLAGVYVGMIRQQNVQRDRLVREGAQQCWKDSNKQSDCCSCRRLSYNYVAIDNQIANGVEETLCMDCAVARGHSGQSIKIMCSDNVRVLERLARYLEEHELLKGKNAEWLELREGRGLRESELHGRSPGVLEVPLPTEPFTWRHLPEIVDVDTVTIASEAINTKRPFPRPDLLLVERLPASKGPSPHSGLSLGGFTNGHPPLFPAKAPCSAPAAYLMSPSYSGSQRAWSPQHMSPGMYSTPDSKAAAALEGQVVGFRSEQAQRSERTAAQNLHRVTAQTGRSRRGSPQSAQAPMYSSSSGPAESAFALAQRSAAEKLHPPVAWPDLGRQGSQLPAQPDTHASSAAAWEAAASAAEQQPLPAFESSLRQEMPAAAQSTPFLQSTWQPALQGSSAAPSQFVADATQPLPAFGPASRQEMQRLAPSARRMQQSGAPERDSWAAAQQEDIRGMTQSWKPLYTVPEEAQLQPELLNGTKAPKTAQQDASKSSMGAKRKHDAVKDSEGAKKPKLMLPLVRSSARGRPAVLQQEGMAMGEDGIEHHRSVYLLQGTSDGPMLDLRDIAKATGWRKRFNLKASSRDMQRLIWKMANEAALANGLDPGALCNAPLPHPCDGSPGPGRFLLGLEHIRIIYALSTQHEREMLQRFCGDLFPVEQMQTLDLRCMKQEADWQIINTCTGAEHQHVIPRPVIKGQPVATDFSEVLPLSPDAAAAAAQKADGVFAKSMFTVIADPGEAYTQAVRAQNPGSAFAPLPYGMLQQSAAAYAPQPLRLTAHA